MDLAKLLFKRRYNKLQKDLQDPFLCQKNIFKYLINRAKNTKWGIEYGYKNINSISDFQKQIPISRYEDLEKYIIEILEEDKENVLWPGKINLFAKSSGTSSSKSKFIPVTKESLKDNHYKIGRDLMATYFKQMKCSKLLYGKSFALAGSRQNKDIGINKYISDISVLLIKFLPWWVKLKRSPKFKVATMSDWELKLPKMANIIRKQNMVSFSGVPSWNLLLMKKVLELENKNDLHKIWPNFELFIHGGVSFSPYKSQFEKLFKNKDINYLEVYNASEGFFAFQDDLKRDDMLLSLNSRVFYEFLALEDIDNDNPKIYTINEVELNKNYALIISTSSGLWRYMIGDTVKFTSLKPHRIIVSGRVKSFINAFGEELIVDNAEKALSRVNEKHNTEIKEYTVAPVFMSENNTGRHQWLIEFNKAPNDLSSYIKDLDLELKSLNSDYEAKRYNDMTLSMPELIIARENLFYDWFKANKRLGGQHKVLRLKNDRQIIDDILKLN
ncbi:MAG TPA: GH3 auxin-responsive promoter family protein [Patescibacteria group bacterium]|nr:GH3 auxin-responsive promoter family protein [Patescibacteria group bacterium]